jgi:hypothetical protein
MVEELHKHMKKLVSQVATRSIGEPIARIHISTTKHHKLAFTTFRLFLDKAELFLKMNIFWQVSATLFQLKLIGNFNFRSSWR